MNYNYTLPDESAEFNVMRGCIPMDINISECGSVGSNLMITVAQPMYDYSPVIDAFNSKIVEPDLQNFYWSFGGVFFLLFFILALGINLMIQTLITHPIQKLANLIRKNDLSSQQRTIRDSQKKNESDQQLKLKKSSGSNQTSDTGSNSNDKPALSTPRTSSSFTTRQSTPLKKSLNHKSFARSEKSTYSR